LLEDPRGSRQSFSGGPGGFRAYYELVLRTEANGLVVMAEVQTEAAVFGTARASALFAARDADGVIALAPDVDVA
jgi:hypothetical protein